MAHTEMPSINRQKTFIIDNGIILNRDTKLTILNIVMMEIGDSVIVETTGANKGVDINLDAIIQINPDVLTHIYHIVSARLQALSKPIRESA